MVRPRRCAYIVEKGDNLDVSTNLVWTRTADDDTSRPATPSR
jgi:hypothetical protein